MHRVAVVACKLASVVGVDAVFAPKPVVSILVSVQNGLRFSFLKFYHKTICVSDINSLSFLIVFSISSRCQIWKLCLE